MAASRKLGKWSRTADVLAAFPEEAKALAEATVIVTGANTGIGKVTAGALASLGGHVVLACRDVAKGEQAIEEIRQASPDKVKSITCLRLNLSVLQGPKDFVEEFRARASKEGWPPLRYLILNAGIFPVGSGPSTSADGLELTFQVNHLSHYLLTRLLLPELRAARPSRVIVVSSASHFGPLLTKDITNKQVVLDKIARRSPEEVANYSGLGGVFRSYGSSKLCNVLFARELHEREVGEGVAACSLHPGEAIATDIGRGSGIVDFLMKRVISWCTKNVDQGSSTSVYCALCPHDTLEGRYFDNCAPAKMNKLANGEDGKKACVVLWDLSEELCRSYL